ncbi:protein transporter tim9 [Entomophthora muscae]|uniref:Protein transporter tim9 n=1 Tax=Entomophthora muscae TaxID=34485 RepID=A0ACC2SMI6_9FUNG|nr:protein transporter tim9 [Entomophthora muscae]
MDLGSLSSADQQKLNEYLTKKQEAEVMTSYLNLTQDCFTACVDDFTSSTLSSNEDKCISKCVKKFLATSERINARFSEENMKLQQAMQ